MKRLSIFILIILIGIIIAFNVNQKNGKSEKELFVLCGAANKLPMSDIAKEFEEKEGVKVVFNFGGSGTLLSQLKLTRKGDIYIPSSPEFLGKGEKEGLVMKETEKIFCYLVPALLVRKENPMNIKSLSDILKKGVKIAICNPETVALGPFTIEIFEKNEILEKAMDNVITYSGNVSKMINAVLLEKAHVGIAWKVSANVNKDLESVILSPKELPRLSYTGGGVTKYVKDKELAQKFLDFASSETGKDVFSKYGYMVNKKDAEKYAPEAILGGKYELPEEYYKIRNNE